MDVDVHPSPPLAGAEPGVVREIAPVIFIIDEDISIRHFLSLVLHGAGIDTEEFSDGMEFRQALTRRKPDVVFLNIPLESADAITSVREMGKAGFFGFVQLISSRGSAVLEHVRIIGDQQKLQMLPVLKKPFETSAILKIIQDLKLGTPPPVAARVGLEEALKNNWLEFWFQPKIDLRKKQLTGAEAFARVRHPAHGILSPGAFLPGADDASLLKLSELAVRSALRAASKFSSLGVNLRIAVNISMKELVKLAVTDIIKDHGPLPDNWPGMIFDVTEEQAITDIPLATDISNRLREHNVRLAIDDFGRGYSSLVRLKELPFAEMKLDRTFVVDCGTDKVNAPICKTVIDLAHNFGSQAVAIGIEKASDAIALVSMGCDIGQGFLMGQPMPEERFLSLLRQRKPIKSEPAEVAENVPA